MMIELENCLVKFNNGNVNYTVTTVVCVTTPRLLIPTQTQYAHLLYMYVNCDLRLNYHSIYMTNALNYKHPNKQMTKLKLCASKTTPPPLPPIHTQ